MKIHFWVVLLLCVITPLSNSQDIVYRKTPLIKSDITCEIGFGQRGADFDERRSWYRRCHESNYCFRASTDRTKIETLKRMFVFPWKAFYEEFYVLGCGGYLETPLYDPWRPHLRPRGFIPPTEIYLNQSGNVLTPGGDQITMKLVYTCNYDMCSSASRSFGSLAAAATITTVLSYLLL